MSEEISNEESTANTQKKNKGGRPRSNVWDHFTTFHDKEGRKAKCNYCGKVYFSDPKKHGTSTLRTHTGTCTKHPCTDELKQSRLSLQPIHEEGGMGSLSNWRFDAELCRKKLVEMIIKDELPFKFVEGEGFIEFIAAIQPLFKIPSRWTISRDCYQLYLNEKLELRDYFKRSGVIVCITTDTWTSLQRLSYMCITAHFITRDWNLSKRIINFCTVDGHKGEEMSRQIDFCLREWGIAKVFTVTVDNASSNDTCLDNLKIKLTSRGCSYANGKFLHMRCVAHIVNLVVNDGLKEIKPSIKKIREAVRFVRNSPARMVKFKECCEEENIGSKKMLCLDVPTRWNSTYLMLDVACKFEKAFEAFEFKDPYFKLDLKRGPPLEVDWINARKMVEVLARFYRLTLRISGSLYVTSNEFFHEITTMCCLLKNWMKSSDGDISSMATQMKIKFDKYWGDPKKMNKLLFVAVIVDPRYKFEFLEYACGEAYGSIDGPILAKDSWDAINELYDAYKLIYQPQSDATMQDDQLIHSEPSLDDMDHHHLGDKFKKRKMLSGESSKNDFEIYLQESVLVAGKDFNILNWWKINQHRFPVLCHIAQDVLAMPISTVASESAFSAGGRVLDVFRSSLTPKIVETLVCTQDWLRRSKDSITIEEDLDGLLMHEEGMKNLTISEVSEKTMDA